MFDSRRKVLVRRLQWLLVAPLVALVLTGLILGGEWLGIESDAFGIDDSLTAALQKGADAVLTAFGLGGYYIPRWLLLGLIAYLFVLVLWSRKSAEKLRERFFPIYDDSRFRPVTRTMPEIGAAQTMPWVKGSRLDAIATDLLKTLRDPAQVGSDAVAWYQPWRSAKPPLAFDHLVVAGRPGAGKSRLIHRLARELGRRDVLGNRGRERPGHEAAAIALERGETRRRRWWFKARWPQDPWDSGILPHDMPESFAAWRPARPTLLWLDDPAAIRAAGWIHRLREYAATYRYPVRLAIVSQSALEGLPAAISHAPITMARHTYFTVADLVWLCRNAALHHITEATCERIYTLTEGNPLLVELALDFLRQGKPVAELSEDAIIAERVSRIRQALDNAHADFRLSAGKHAAALGTLAGPDCPISAVIAQFPGISLSRESLAAAFPSEALRGLDLAQVMPSVRPLMIGDAFVRSIAADRADLPEVLTAGTLAAGPERFLTALERLGRRPGPLTDALCDPALWRSDWPEEFRLRYHQTLIGLALRGCRDGPATAAQVAAQLDGLPAAERAAAEDALYAWIEAEAAALAARIAASDQRWHADLAAGLTPTEARRAQDQEALGAPAFQFFAGRPLAIFWSMLAARSVGRSKVEDWNAAFVASRRGLVERYHGLLSQLDTAYLTEADTLPNWHQLFPRPAKASSAALFAVELDMASAIPFGLTKNVNLSLPLRKAMAVSSRLGDTKISELIDLQDQANLCNDPAEAVSIARRAERVAELVRQEPDSPYRSFTQSIVALCWYKAARADGIAADTMIEIEAKLSFWDSAIIANSEAELVPGLALTTIGLARSRVAGSARTAPAERPGQIEQVERIIAAQQQRGLAIGAVSEGLIGALAQRCHDLLGEPDSCRLVLDRIDRIIAEHGWIDVAYVGLDVASAWRFHAGGLQHDPDRFEAALGRVETISLRPRFANDSDFKIELAKVYAYAVFAYSAIPAVAEDYFRRIHVIASHPALAGPGDAQLSRVLANQEIALIHRHDPVKYAEFENLLRDFVANVNPEWHEYARFQEAVRTLELSRP